MPRRSTHLFARATVLAAGLGCLLAQTAAFGQTVDFDALAVGSEVDAIPPVTFTHSEPGIDLVVASGESTTSMANYLGAAYLLGPSQDEQDLFLPGETLTLELDVPAHSISITVLSTPGTPAGAFELVTPEGSTTSDDTPDGTAGGDEIYLLSFSSTTPFSEATLRSSYADGLFAFHVDDVAVPEPGLVPLVVAGCGWVSLLARRRSCFAIESDSAA